MGQEVLKSRMFSSSGSADSFRSCSPDYGTRCVPLTGRCTFTVVWWSSSSRQQLPSWASWRKPFSPGKQIAVKYQTFRFISGSTLQCRQSNVGRRRFDELHRPANRLSVRPGGLRGHQSALQATTFARRRTFARRSTGRINNPHIPTEKPNSSFSFISQWFYVLPTCVSRLGCSCFQLQLPAT